jgi:hypothetical protein
LYLGGSGNRSDLFLGPTRGSPKYQFDLIIEQLDDEMNVTSKIKVQNAFVNIVGDIQYTDEEGEVSKTTVTISYTGLDIR